jgi:hypothetical protein
MLTLGSGHDDRRVISSQQVASRISEPNQCDGGRHDNPCHGACHRAREDAGNHVPHIHRYFIIVPRTLRMPDYHKLLLLFCLLLSRAREDAGHQNAACSWQASSNKKGPCEPLVE